MSTWYELTRGKIMSISLCVSGITPPDDEFYKMKAIWDSCNAAGIDVPEKVLEYFDWKDPDEKGITRAIDYCTTNYSERYSSGYDIELSKLDPNIRFIRVTLC